MMNTKSTYQGPNSGPSYPRLQLEEATEISMFNEFLMEYKIIKNIIARLFYMKGCKHLQRSQSHSVELFFATLLEKFLD